MSDTPLIYADALAADKNILSIMQAMAASPPARPRTRPQPQAPPLKRLSIISLTDSEGEQVPDDHDPSPPRPKSPGCVPQPSRVFVIEGTVETDEEYQEYRMVKAHRQAARETKRAAQRGRSAERHAEVSQERQRSAEAHERLAKSAGKLPEQRHALPWKLPEQRPASSRKLPEQHPASSQKLPEQPHAPSSSYTGDTSFEAILSRLDLSDGKSPFLTVVDLLTFV